MGGQRQARDVDPFAAWPDKQPLDIVYCKRVGTRYSRRRVLMPVGAVRGPLDRLQPTGDFGLWQRWQAWD